MLMQALSGQLFISSTDWLLFLTTAERLGNKRSFGFYSSQLQSSLKAIQLLIRHCALSLWLMESITTMPSYSHADYWDVSYLDSPEAL